MRLIVAITGASGAVYGKRILEVLKKKNVETHLIVSRAAEKVIKYEFKTDKNSLEKNAFKTYNIDDLTAPLVSGSFKTDGMIIVPCSMKTLAGIANGYSNNLILRAADVTIKERRLLVAVIRETPLNVIHLKNMLKLAEIGVAILPASPAFYHKPDTIEDLVNYVIGKILDLLNIEHELYERWKGIKN